MLKKSVLAVVLLGSTMAAAAGRGGPLQAQGGRSEEPTKRPVTEAQKAIDADTEKLVQMAAELKVSVDKSNKNELSLDVIRKADAVEKLAKSLKERIRATH